VASLFKIVSVAVIAAILGSTQCGELCSFLFPEREAKITPAQAHEMPCHGKHAPKNPQPVRGEQCSHHELLAENRSGDASANDEEGASISFFRINAHIVPAHSSSPLTAALEQSPRRSRPASTPILRI
jgi:hypothetical protein